jgi:L-seryl-tRNA(Ser) seleniumtransferase
VNALAADREVIVSRGELIEIGGSFRLPDVIVSGGAILKEVGTTNRTCVSDYSAAVTDKTALLLKCHRSNFEISGFTEQPDPSELAVLARASNIPFVEDLGSGALIDLSLLGLKPEPTVQETLENADVVLFSGDKLLGGSQAGLIVGKKELVDKLRKHPTYRALRLDKLNIALLEQTLAEYLHPDVIKKLPVYEMAARSLSELQMRASRLVERLTPRLKSLTCCGVEAVSAFGGGTMPAVTIKSFALKIDTAAGASISAAKVGAALRAHERPIVAIISDESVVIDLRTVALSEDAEIEAALCALDDRLR